MSHVTRIDTTGRPLAPAVKAAYEEELRRAGRVTNMKAVLLHSLPAFKVFSGWHTVKDEVRAAVGERALSIYSHAISATAGCLLCSTYFRRLLLNEGVRPEDFAPTAEEALLIELGHAIGNRRKATAYKTCRPPTLRGTDAQRPAMSRPGSVGSRQGPSSERAAGSARLARGGCA